MNKRLLIISHNIIDASNNVGKTLISMLKKWPHENIYSLYFRNEVRQTMLPASSYMITDKDIIKSLYKGKACCGQVVDRQEGTQDVNEDMAAYRFGNKRYPIVSLIRDDLWHLKRWKTEGMDQWLRQVNPDLILFVPNDYVLAFEVTEYVKAATKAPVITFFTDDAFYFGQKISGIDRIRRNRLRKIGRRIASDSASVFTASQRMQEEYREILGVESKVIGNCVEISLEIQKKDWKTAEQIVFSYVGNLHSNRWKSLIELGECIGILNESCHQHIVLDIYSASDLPDDIKAQITAVSAIRMKGAIPPQQVKTVQEASDALVHIEAFDEKSKKSTRLSMSTKIFEYMSRGLPIFAYGPSDISSMDFLHSNHFAVCCFGKALLMEQVNRFVFHEDVRNAAAEKAYEYAKIHFEEDYISSEVLQILTSVLCSADKDIR